jgi:hypothetical protein
LHHLDDLFAGQTQNNTRDESQLGIRDTRTFTIALLCASTDTIAKPNPVPEMKEKSNHHNAERVRYALGVHA